MDISFPDGAKGEIPLNRHEYFQLVDYARRGFRILAPVLLEGKIVYLNVVDIRVADENLDRRQLMRLGGKVE